MRPTANRAATPLLGVKINLAGEGLVVNRGDFVRAQGPVKDGHLVDQALEEAVAAISHSSDGQVFCYRESA